MLHPLISISFTCGVYLTILLTIIRYIAVCQQNIARTIITKKMIRIYIACVILLSLVWNFPTWFESKLKEVLMDSSLHFFELEYENILIFLIWRGPYLPRSLQEMGIHYCTNCHTLGSFVCFKHLTSTTGKERMYLLTFPKFIRITSRNSFQNTK